MGSREFIGAVVSAWLVAGCGPTTGPLGESMDTGTTTSEVTSSDGNGTDTGGSEGTESGRTDDREGSTDDGDASSTGPVVGDVEMYGSCSEDNRCAPGLSCTPVASGAGATICTAQCTDPVLDCDAPPDGWSATCGAFLHVPPDPFCAIGCDEETPCPEDMSCGLDSPPFYCVPGDLE